MKIKNIVNKNNFILIDYLRKIIDDLNKEEETILIVEGKKDIKALRSFGFKGKILEYRQLLEFLYKEGNAKKFILLLDFDQEGKKICKKIYNLLSIKGYKVDLYYWRKINELKKYGLHEIEDIYAYLKNEWGWLNESSINS
jgi:5S rRNA maturation endonuclease (ribonuclease M5)